MSHRQSGVATRHLLRSAACIGTLVLSAHSACAAPDTWHAAVNGSFSDGTKWSLNAPPGSADDATISFSTITVSFNTNATVNSLFNDSDLQILGGTLAGAQASAASVVTIDGGELALGGGGLSNLTLGPGAGTIVFGGNGNNALSGVIMNHDIAVLSGGYAQLFNANSLGASVNLAGGGNGLQLRDGNATLSINASGVIRGGGASIFQTFGGATLLDNGLVSADQSGNVLTLSTSNITGSGILEAKNGGVLSIAGVMNGAGLQVHVDNTPGSLVQINGGGLSGTLASTTGTGLSFANNGNNTVTSATINGDLTFDGGAYTQAFGVSTVSSTIHMSGTANGIQLRDGNATLSIGATGAVRGFGRIYQSFGGANFENNGIVSADTSAQTLRIDPSNLNGSGIFEAKNGGVLSIGGLLKGNSAVVHVDSSPGSSVVIDGGGLTGSFSSSTGSGISFANNGNNAITLATIGADLTLNGGAYVQVFGANTESGTIHMAGTANGIQLRDGNASLTISSAGSVRGFGRIFSAFGGNFVNNGTSSADTSGQTLRIDPPFLFGSGVFEAKNGGVLSIGGLLNGNNAVVHVDANPASAVLVDGGGLTGSFGASAGGGIGFAANGNNLITFATIGADMTFVGGAYAQVFGVNSESGTIHMSGTANGIQLRDGNATLTIDSAGSVRGFGRIFQSFGGANLVNNGTISADVSGQILRIDASNLFSSGVFDARNGGVISLGGTVTGLSMPAVQIDSTVGSAVLVDGGGLTGTFDIAAPTDSPGFSFANNGNNFISSASIGDNLTFNGGAYAQLFGVNTVRGTIHMAGTANGIQLRDGNATLNIGTTGAIRGYGQIFQAFGGSHLANNGVISSDTAGLNLAINTSEFINNGSFEVVTGATASCNAALTQNSGRTTVNGTLTLASPFALAGGLLSGSGGTVNGTVNNSAGTVSPGNSPGILTIAGNYTQQSGGSFLVELGGYTAGSQFDQLDVTGAANLAGTIDVDLTNGFTPNVGDHFDVMLRNGGSGAFGTLTTEDPGLVYSVQYFNDRVQITILNVPEPASALLVACTIPLRKKRRRAT